MSSVRFDRTATGELIAWIHRDPSRALFRQCADEVTQYFGAEGRDRVEGMGQAFWDFVIGRAPFTLHLDAKAGIAVLSGERSEVCESLVMRVAAHLAESVLAAPR